MKKKSIFDDYVGQRPAAASFFNLPLKPDWLSAARNIAGEQRHRDFVQLLYEQNKHTEDPAVHRVLKSLNEKPPLFVVTGQQTGLFVSPMYTIYKTLSAIHLARSLQRRLPDYNVCPLFWIEGEDHDYKEVASLWVWTKEGRLQSFSLAEQEKEKGFSMGRRRLPASVNVLLDELKAALPLTDFSRELFSVLQSCYQPQRNWAEAFACLIRHIFYGTGLLLFLPGDPQIKSASVPFFEQLIQDNEAVLAAFSAQAENIDAGGYALQVHLRKSLAYIYLSDGGGARQHIYRDNEAGFIRADRKKRWKQNELIDYARQHPEWFSSTVLTRPLWQSWMLPVISYVAGPAEIAYWAMLKKAFERLNLYMPHLQPRASFTLVEPAIQRLLEKLNIDPAAVTPDAQNFVREQLKQTDQTGLAETFRSLRAKMRTEQEHLSPILKEVDPTLTPAGQKTFFQIEKSLNALEAKALKRLEEKERQKTTQLQRIREHFYPQGKKQERLIAPLYFINKYGFDWVKEIGKKIDPDDFSHRIFYLS